MIVYTLSFHAGTAGDRLKGTYFLPVYLTGAVYLDFLRNFLPELLQDVDMQTMVHLWFMHDQVLYHIFLQFGHS
jgi:hypothetical protein